MMKRLGLVAGIAALVGLSFGFSARDAAAACAATIAGKDGTGAAITTCDTTDGSTGLVPSMGVLGGTNNANKLTVNADGSINAAPEAAAVGGATIFTLNSAATTNATNVKASAGTLYHISVQNKAATEEFLTFYNTAGTPTCGTSVVMTLQIPAVTSTGNAVGGIVEDFSVGANFGTGIAICATTAIAGTGSVALNDLTINLAFK